MPILRKDSQRIYFVQIPAVPGEALLYAFLRAGYQVSNVGPVQGPWAAGPVGGFREKIVREFGITAFPIEGDMSGVFSAVEHATWESWSRWGPYDQSFALLQHPVDRFCAGVWVLYGQQLGKMGQKHSNELYAATQERFLARFEQDLSKWARNPGNPFLKLSSYLLPQTRLYCLERDGVSSLSRDFGLPDVGYSFKKERYGVREDLIAFARDYFAEDIDFYHEQFGQGQAPGADE